MTISRSLILFTLLTAAVLFIPIDVVFTVFGIRITVCEILFSLAFFVWIAHAEAVRNIFAGKQLLYSAIGVITASALSIGAAQNRFVALRETIQFAWLFAIFFMIADLFGRDRALVTRFWLATFLVAFCASVMGIAQYLFVREPPDFLVTTTRLRAFGFHHQPNAFGTYLTPVLVMLVAIFLGVKEGFLVGWQRMRTILTSGAILALMIGACAFALCATFSRGSWAGTLAGLLCIPMLGRYRFEWKRFVIAAAIAIASALLVIIDVSVQPEPVERAFSNRQRLLLIEAGWNMFLDHPVTGVGAGNFGVRLQEYAGSELMGTLQTEYDPETKSYFMNPHKKQDVEIVHNLVIQIAAEEGLVGIVAFLWFVLVLVGRVRAHLLPQEDEHFFWIRRGAGAALLGLLVSSMLGWHFSHGVQEILILTVATMLASPSGVANRGELA